MTAVSRDGARRIAPTAAGADVINAFLAANAEKSQETLRNYRSILRNLAKSMGKAPDRATKAEVFAWLLPHQNKPGTWNQYLTVARTFYTWAKKRNFLKGLKFRKAQGKIDVIRPEDVQWLLEACQTARDVAMVLLMVDCGFRAGEVASMRVRDVEYDAYGVKVACPKSKTRPRAVRGIECTAALSAWMARHPFKSDPEAPLFPVMKHQRGRYGRPIQPKYVWKLVHQIETRAKMLHPDLRHVFPHMCRHYSATQAAKLGLSESLLMLRYGWKTPDMARRYVHLTGGDADNKFLELQGIVKAKDQPSSWRDCPRCHARTRTGDLFCPQCGAPRDVRVSQDGEQYRVDILALIGEILQNRTTERETRLRDLMGQITDARLAKDLELASAVRIARLLLGS